MFLIQGRGVFRRISSDEINNSEVYDIDDNSVIFEFDYDDDAEEDARTQLEDYVCPVVLYTSNDDAKLVLIIKDLSMSNNIAHVDAYVCNDKEEAYEIASENYGLEFNDNECNDTISMCGSEQYFRKVYPIVGH